MLYVNSLNKKDLTKLFRKYKITSTKYMGDDCYSWAVFVNNVPKMEGLSRSEVMHYKKQILKYKLEHENSEYKDENLYI